MTNGTLEDVPGVVYEATRSIVTVACVNQTVKNGLFFVYINKTNKTAERNCKQNKQMPRKLQTKQMQCLGVICNYANCNHQLP